MRNSFRMKEALVYLFSVCSFCFNSTLSVYSGLKDLNYIFPEGAQNICDYAD